MKLRNGDILTKECVKTQLDSIHLIQKPVRITLKICTKGQMKEKQKNSV